MQIDESLAKGLKNKFFRDLTASSKLSLAKVRGQSRGKRTRNGFVKSAQATLSNFSGTSVYQYEGGSSSAPYFAFDSLLAISERELNSWQEKCLSSISVILLFEANEPHFCNGAYNIGEHLISRLIQRSGLVDDPLKFNPRTVIDELVYVPLWSNFWLLMSMFEDDYQFDDELTIPVPAKHGLMLGHLNPISRLVELRTYVDDSKLAENQRVIRDMMLSHSKLFLNSPLNFAFASAMKPHMGVHHSLMLLLAGLVVNDKFSDILINYMTERYDDQVRQLAKKRLLKRLRQLCEHASPELYELLITHGLKKYLIELQSSLLRLRHTYAD